jgi:hypothetical protein
MDKVQKYNSFNKFIFIGRIFGTLYCNYLKLEVATCEVFSVSTVEESYFSTLTEIMAPLS